ncbi:LPXTG cell wall anchor domain-containing protein [Staphylospora marina]|uniref:LPXTG cell wall anchor domain-containing protein n=1 Tax=Staphylospora marina TaxID=2490858 RepID=UPI0013DDDAA2|nr:LPXTG cell wall anchor domain-containing protein [Staphylospora marina]
MKKINITKFSLIAMVLALALVIAPAGAMAQSTAKIDLNVDLLGKANILNIVKVGGDCKAIWVKVKVGNLVGKELGKVVNNLKIEVPYEIYWYPNLGAVDGKLVADGKLQVKGEDETLTVRYEPAKNPNGPAGIYAIKLKLAVNSKLLDNLAVAARVKVNGPCDGDNGNNNPPDNNDDDNNNNPPDDNDDNNNNNNPPDNNDDNNNNNPPDNNDDDDNNNNNNPPKDDDKNNNKPPKNDDNNQGGQLPKTATNHPNGMLAGFGLLIIGLAALFFARRKGIQ